MAEYSKRPGRFIKKHSKLADVVSVKNFSLIDICAVPVTYPDNPNGNIIHQYLHEDAELADGIRRSSEIDTNLEQGFRPILQPMDFTEEWNRQKNRLSAGNSRYDEEDELELELEYLNKKKKGDPSSDETPNNSSETKAIAPEQNATEEQKEPPIIPEQQAPPILEEQTPNQSLDPTQQEIAEENIHSTESGESSQANFRIQKDNIASVADAINQVSEPDDGIQNLASHKITESDEFTPMKTDTNGINPEVAAMDEYKQQSLISEEEKQKLIEEAKSIGYNEGFKIGEQKAALQFQEQNHILLQRFQQSMQHMQSLKKNILQNAQENFVILAKALSEALLRKEFQLDPNALAAVISRVIDETVPGDEFKILVNEQTRDHLQQSLPDKLAEKLTVAEGIETFDFKIESNLTVVDGKVTQIVSDLLENANLDLFESDNKAS